MPTVLTLANISYQQSGHTLLDNIDFSVATGQILGLLGINGAGKSTTLKVAAGILTPSKGSVSIHSEKPCGYVPENPPLIHNWTVKRFLQHSCTLQSLPSTTHEAAMQRVSQQCELSNILDKTCETLSKGNQQRVAIAQALLHQPDVLILDEPTSGLDPKQISLFRALLQQIKQHTAIVFSSHIMQEITALCDTAIIIHNGLQLDTLDLSQYKRHLLITFTQAQPDSAFAHCPAWHAGHGKQHQFLLHESETSDEILAYCLQHNLSIHRISGSEQWLEDEFLTRIGQAA